MYYQFNYKSFLRSVLLFVFISSFVHAQTKFIINNKGEVQDKNFKDFVTKNHYQAISAFDTVSKKPLLIYAQYIKDNKIGIIDVFGKEITPPVYNDIIGLDRDIPANTWGFLSKYVVVSNKKYGLIDNKGHQIIPFEYDGLYYENKDSIFWGMKNNQKIYMDAKGNAITYTDPFDIHRKYIPEYDKTLNAAGTEYQIKYNYKKITFDVKNLGDIKSIYNNWVTFFDKATKKYGVYDMKNKKLVIPIIYDKVNYSAGGLFIVAYKNNYGVIDSTGKIRFPVEAQAIEAFSGATLIYKDGKYAVYTSKLKKLYDYEFTRYTFVNPMGIGLIKDGKQGMLAPDDKIVFDFKFDNIQMYYGTPDFSYPIIIATLNNKMYITNIEGKRLSPTDYDMILPECLVSSESNSLFPESFFKSNQPNLFYFFKQGGKYGLLDNNFKVILNNEYDMMLKTGERKIVCVEKGGKWGLVDIYTRKLVLPIEYDFKPLYVSRNYFSVLKDHKFGLLTDEGKVIIPIEETQPTNLVSNIYKGLIKMDVTINKKIYFDYLGDKIILTE